MLELLINMEKLLLVYSLLFSVVIITCSATTYTVGDSSGWDISTNLDAWIADKNFRVGDALGKSLKSLVITQGHLKELMKSIFEFIKITCNFCKLFTLIRLLEQSRLILITYSLGIETSGIGG